MIRVFEKYDSQSDLNRIMKKYLKSSNFNWTKDFLFMKIRGTFLLSDMIYVFKVAPTKSVAAEVGFVTIRLLGYNISDRKLSFHACIFPDGDPLITGLDEDEKCVCYGKAPLSFIYLWNNSELGELKTQR